MVSPQAGRLWEHHLPMRFLTLPVARGISFPPRRKDLLALSEEVLARRRNLPYTARPQARFLSPFRSVVACCARSIAASSQHGHLFVTGRSSEAERAVCPGYRCAYRDLAWQSVRPWWPPALPVEPWGRRRHPFLRRRHNPRPPPPQGQRILPGRRCRSSP